MVAAGLSGPARASAGAVRDHVLGVQMLNSKAELLSFGGQVMKNVAGYDMSRLMAGSLGTLGVLTEVSLKVLPLSTAQATLLFEFDQAAALRQLNDWGRLPLPLNASCWVPREGRGRLQVRLRGAQAAVLAACQSMGGERLDEAEANSDWAALREQTLPFFACVDDHSLWRLSVPDTSPPLRLDVAPDGGLVEWGGALRWVKAASDVAVRLREAVGAVGGTATLFRQALRQAPQGQPVFHPLSAALRHIHQDLKKQFDPAGLFNRGRLYADL